ncbi:hypothetical protein [Streptomyces arboris]|uniref:Uncharacterized protein n=1 Tax=Streptomyces arboris TaxID=2600619 RepID=A0A5N5EAW8_9ACTN|nr:hypothetical protein [Streptomyces arboris]KAB2587718.1 hypothetical protein F5983_36380 [Streptomyces arboris]
MRHAKRSPTPPPAWTSQTPSAWTPPHYAVHVQAAAPGAARTLLRLGPYTQTGHATRDADRLTALLNARQLTPAPGARLSAATTPFHAARHHQYTDPDGADVGALLAAALTR